MGYIEAGQLHDELKGMTKEQLGALRDQAQAEIDRRKEALRIESLRNLQAISASTDQTVGKLLDACSAKGFVVVFLKKEG